MTCSCETCFYCDMPLSVRHEHDHMPLAQRHGGTEVVAACINCHDLKDRMRLSSWDPEYLFAALADAGPMGRILLARLWTLIADIEQAAA